MERLTYRTQLGVSIDKNEDCPTCSICWSCDIPPRKCKYVSDALEKLAEYEDLEEQGKFLKLPCKVGDMLYWINGKFIIDYKITGFSVDEDGVWFMYIEHYDKTADKTCSYNIAVDRIGKTIFFSKPEAEAKLKELRGGEND